jgi:hypothetical protein
MSWRRGVQFGRCWLDAVGQALDSLRLFAGSGNRRIGCTRPEQPVDLAALVGIFVYESAARGTLSGPSHGRRRLIAVLERHP